MDRATATATFGIDVQGAVVNLRLTNASDQDWGSGFRSRRLIARPVVCNLDADLAHDPGHDPR
jgi:hypothetical protein